MTKYISIKGLGKKWLIANWIIIFMLLAQLCILLIPNSNLQSFALSIFPFVGLVGIIYAIMLINANIVKDKEKRDK